MIAAAGCGEATDRAPYPGSCRPFELVGSDPSSWQEGVQTNPAVTLTYSDYPDPDSVSVESIVLTTGAFRRTLKYEVDLIKKRIRLRPTVPLERNLTHAVSVFQNLRSVQGCTPSRNELWSFRTGDGPGVETPPPPEVGFSDVLAIFRQSCAGSGCHRGDGPTRPDGPCEDGAAPKGLSLCDDRAYELLVGVPSVEVSRLRRVDPGESARSYLLRKILPGHSPEARMPGVLGERMGPTLSDLERRTIADWIDSGAPR